MSRGGIDIGPSPSSGVERFLVFDGTNWPPRGAGPGLRWWVGPLAAPDPPESLDGDFRYYNDDTTVPPHVHVIGDTTGLQAALDAHTTAINNNTAAIALKAAISTFTSGLLVRRVLHASQTGLTTAAASGTPYFIAPGQADLTALVIGSGATARNVTVLDLDPAELDVIPGYTPKLRIRARCFAGTGNPNQTFDVKLHSATVTSANIVLGAAVAGSTCSVPVTAVSSKPGAAGADFDVPAADSYALTVTPAGVVGANLVVWARVSLKYVAIP